MTFQEMKGIAIDAAKDAVCREFRLENGLPGMASTTECDWQCPLHDDCPLEAWHISVEFTGKKEGM